MLADGGLLLLGDLLPVLGHQSGSLDSGLLPNTEVLMGGDNLDEKKERFGVCIVVFL